MKKLICLILALITAFAFTACNNKNKGDSTSTGDAPQTVNLNLDKNTEAEITILIPGGNSNEETMIDALIEDFALMYPRVKIDYNYVTVNSYDSQIRNLASTGTLDDIVWSNSPDFYYLVNKNLVYNLNPYIEASEKAGVFNLEEDFHSEFFDMGSIGGNLYCVPRSADSVVTFINTDIFEKAGVDMSLVKNGWTWDTFLSVCETIRQYFDSTGKGSSYVLDANLTSWLSVCYPMLCSYGADVIDENGNIIIDSAATKKCLEMVRYMVEKRYIVDSQEASGSSFEAGTSAMLFQSASFSLFAERMALKNKIDLVSFPLITENNTPKIGCGIAGYCINKNTKYADVCWAFLNYMLSYDGQQKMANNGLNLASIRKDLADPTTANWGIKYPGINMSSYLYGSEYKLDTAFLSRLDPSMKPDFTTALKDMFNSACNATKDIDAAIDQCVEDMEYALDEY
ncbi:MAG: extracellular solute-binding protein [Clostridia bacterium]|nr:extracellular solute-binding protein [Clostridia bacterium]